MSAELRLLTRIIETRDMSPILQKPYFTDPELWGKSKRTEEKYDETGNLVIESIDLGGYEDEFRFIRDHFIKWGEVPTKSVVLDRFPNLTFEPDDFNSIEFLIDDMDRNVLWNSVMVGWEDVKAKVSDINNTNEYEAATEFITFGEKVEKTKQSLCKQNRIELSKSAKTMISDLEDKKIKPKIKSGFEELDKELCGGFFSKKELVALIAPSGTGKTWITLSMALSAWKQKKRIGLVSAEMDQQDILERLATLESHSDYNDVTAGKFIDVLKNLTKMLEEREIFILDPITWDNRSTMYLRHFCKMNELDALYIDGGQYIEPETFKKEEADWQRLMKSSRELYQISCELEIPIIVSYQCNRSGSIQSKKDRKPPLPENIGESSKIIEACTKIISIGHYDNELKLAITKSRKTKEGNIVVYDWCVEKGTFDYIRTEPYFEVESEEETESPQKRKKNDIDKKVRQSLENTEKQKKKRKGAPKDPWET